MKNKEHLAIHRLLALSVLCVLVVLAAAVPARGAVTPSQTPEPPLQRLELSLSGSALAAPPAPDVPNLPAATTTITYAVDTEIWRGQPATNFGEELEIDVGYRDGHPGRMLLDIPLWDVAPGATISSAELQFALTGWYDYSGQVRTLTAHRLTAPWHEWLAIWNNAPIAAEAVGSVPVGTPYTITWYSIDLTGVARGWHDGTHPNFGLLITGPEGGQPVYRTIASSETTLYPRLVVTYSPTPPTLSAAPSALTLLAGGLVDPSRRLTISNAGSSPLDWQASPGASTWISLSQTSGTLPASSAETIELTVDTSGLAYGIHQGQVQVTTSTPDAQGSPQIVDVTLHYLDGLYSVFLPIAPKTHPDPAPPRDTVALLIGISDYLHAGPPPASGARAGDWGTGDLFFARYDTLKTGEVLQHYDFFTSKEPPDEGAATLQAAGADGGDLLVLTEAQASHAGIEAAFQWLDAHEDEDTLVLFAFSGHGGQLPDDDGDESDGLDEFLATYDTDEVSGGLVNVIRDDELDAWLSELESDRVVVLLDSCFSAGMMDSSAMPSADLIPRGTDLPEGLRSQPQAGGVPDGILFDLRQPGREILTASDIDQVSWESGLLRHGVFTYFLLLALVDPAADTNDNGWVSAEEAFPYLAPRVDGYIWEATEGAYHQNPRIYDGVPGSLNLTYP